jgi:hypothetical protein
MCFKKVRKSKNTNWGKDIWQIDECVVINQACTPLDRARGNWYCPIRSPPSNEAKPIFESKHWAILIQSTTNHWHA